MNDSDKGLRLAAAFLDAIRAHAEETYPHECCGFLFGKVVEGEKIVAGVRRAGNRREDSPHNRYSIAPQDSYAAEQDARARGVDIVGYYHSHPDHPAEPSRYDREYAAWVGYSYLIVPVEAGRAGAARTWVLRDPEGEFEEEPLTSDAGEARWQPRS